MDLTFLPHVNATLNATSGVLLLTGFYFVKKGRRGAHKNAMFGAVSCSAVFLVCYVIYHYSVGSVKFTGQGWIRPVYFTILISHTILAVALVPLVIMTLSRALRERFDRHRKIAKITFPVWIYVSFTGVAVYWLLYHAYPSSAVPA